MKLKLGQCVVERTGYAPGDRVAEWVARCYLAPSLSGMRFAYGATAGEAVETLCGLLEQEYAEISISNKEEEAKIA